MDTSGDGVVNGLLYAVLLVAALALAPRLPRLPRRRDRPVPAAAVTLWLLVAVPSILGLVFPRVYTALYRDPALILEQGQWWRVVTSVGVQDGGLRGAVFNLVALAVAAHGWAAAGGGNSAATFGLAASLGGLALVASSDTGARLLALVPLAVAGLLVALDDGHAVPVLCGVVVGGGLAARTRWFATSGRPHRR